MVQPHGLLPALRAFVVGHIDNRGAFARNQNLSPRRAEAVSKALSPWSGIAAARLPGKGVASLSPVASNENGPGRMNNRRVELVLQ